MKKNRLFIIVFSIIAIYTIVGFILVPNVVKSQLQDILNKNLTKDSKIGKISFNPFLFKILVEDFSIFDKKEITFSSKELLIDFSPINSIHEGHISFQKVNIKDAFIDIIQTKDGKLNLESLVKKQKNNENKQDKSEKNVKFQIDKLALDNAKVKFTKQFKNKKDFKLDINSINNTFYDIGTFKNRLASYSFRALINQETNLEINGGIRLEPFKMYGNLRLQNFKPSDYLDYKKELFNFEISKKTYANLEFGYQVDDEKELRFQIDNGDFNLNKLDIKQNNNSLLSLKHLNIDEINLHYPQNIISASKIELNTLNSILEKDKLGVLNYSKLVNIDDKTSKKEEETNEKEKNWNLNLDEFKLVNSNIIFNDLENELKANAKQVNIQIFKILNKENLTVKDIFMKIPTFSLEKPKNKLNITGENLEITAVNPSINNKLKILDKVVLNTKNFVLKQGNDIDVLADSLTLENKNIKMENDDLNIENTSLNVPNMQFNSPKNNISLKNQDLKIITKNTLLSDNKSQIKSININKKRLFFNDIKNNREILADNLSFEIDNVNYDKKATKISNVMLKHPKVIFKDKANNTDILAKDLNINIQNIKAMNNKLKIASSNIKKPYLSVILGKELNSSKKTKITKKTKTKKSKKQDFSFDIGPVNISDMQMDFEDKNLSLPFKTNISKLSGKFSRLNSSSSKPTKLQLEGKVDNYGYTKIVGTVDINDVKLLTDTNILFKNIAIKNLSPYSVKFVGRKIEDGKLNLDLKYNIKKSDIKAENIVVINDIKLGEKVKSKDAADLPLDLAVALLEDGDGVIHIDLPIKGNLDDPQFSIAPIVWKVFTNLITKAITAPFTLLASMFGVDEEKIKSIEFNFGKSDILISEKESLDNIAKILKEKPKLAIKVTPSYNPIKDKIALQNIKFDKYLKEKMIKISQGDEYKIALEKLYKKEKDVKPLEEVEKSFTSKEDESLNVSEYVKYLKEVLVSKQDITKKELNKLNKNRIENIRKYLLVEKKLPKNSVKFEKTKEQKDEQGKWSIFSFDISTR